MSGNSLVFWHCVLYSWFVTAAVTSRANQQYIVACKCSEGSTEGVRVSPFAHILKVKPSELEMYVKRHATPSMIYNKPDWPVRTLGLTKEKWSNNVSLRVKYNSEA